MSALLPIIAQASGGIPSDYVVTGIVIVALATVLKPAIETVIKHWSPSKREDDPAVLRAIKALEARIAAVEAKGDLRDVNRAVLLEKVSDLADSAKKQAVAVEDAVDQITELVRISDRD